MDFDLKMYRPKHIFAVRSAMQSLAELPDLLSLRRPAKQANVMPFLRRNHAV